MAALVVGASGIIGNSICNLLASSGKWQVYGTGRRGKPQWMSDSVRYVQVDLLNKEDVASKLSSLKHTITHLFWAAWIPKETEEENCHVNGSMLTNVLEGFAGDDSKLEHICLTTGCKHYLGPLELFGTEVSIPEAPFREDTPRLPFRNFYYVQEDIVSDMVRRSGGRVSYSVHRPNTVLGFAPRNYMNAVAAIAVYATICKWEKIPFIFAGTNYAWEVLCDASDADLVAEQEVWAATAGRAKNQAFNITNGDLFRWKHVWGVIARKIGVEEVTEEVQEHGLAVTKLKDVGQFWFVDLFLNRGPGENLSCMNKSKEYGFSGFRNTETSFEHWIDELRKQKIIP